MFLFELYLRLLICYLLNFGGTNLKIIAYGVRDDELPYFTSWAQHQKIEVKVVTDELTMSNVDQANGFDGIIIVYQKKPFTAELIDKIDSLGIKAISSRNAGIDNIDLRALAKNGMQLTNVPAYSPGAIAEFSVTQALNLLRKTKVFSNKVQEGDFLWAPDIADELSQQTVGVVGTGRIGQAAIKIYQGFGAKVLAYDVFQNPDLVKKGLYVNTLTELYQKADILTLHIPATEDNKYLLDAVAFNNMKKGIKIINAARGSLVDTEELIKALDSKKVGGAAIDVYENESEIFNRKFSNFSEISDKRLQNLIRRDNVLITPHIAFYTQPAVRNMVKISLDNNLQLIKTGVADNLVTLPKD